MRVQLERTGQLPGQKKWHCYSITLPSFELYWHNHEAYELTFIYAGYGKRLVGDNIAYFEKGDLVLLGPYLPHSWVSDITCPQPVQAFVLQLSPDFLELLIQIPGMDDLQQLLKAAKFGLSLNDMTSIVYSFLKELEGANPSIISNAKLLLLFNKLCTLKQSKLASDVYCNMSSNGLMLSRLNKVLQWLNNNFTNPNLQLSNAANLLHMQESAFSKFFKKHTRQTFTSFLNELRITYACRLLVETDEAIALIAYTCGFGNISYFNRTFLTKKGITPKEYRKRYN